MAWSATASMGPNQQLGRDGRGWGFGVQGIGVQGFGVLGFRVQGCLGV